MTTLNSARGLRGSRGAGFTTKRRQAGTSLVEILVVIVIFLIGILAVVQIFPRGFRLLLTSRNNSVATAIGRDEVERLKSNPDLLPEAILPVRYSGNVPLIDNTINPRSLGPTGDRIFSDGRLFSGGSAVKDDWELASGPNIARRIIGEGQRVPAPRRIDLENKGGLITTDKDMMSSYGCLLVLDHGPVDANGPIVAYANDLSRNVGDPRDTVDETNKVTVATYSPDGKSQLNTFDGVISNTPVATAPFEFFVSNPDRGDASILFPATYNFPRLYRIRMSAYVGDGAGYVRNDYISLCVAIPKVARGKSFVRVYLGDILAKTPGAMVSGATFGSAELDTIRIAPLYVQVQGADWTSRATVATTDPAYVAGDYTPINPFEVKVVDPNLGTLLFSPAARQGVVSRPGGVSEPLLAKVDYDVLDWRVIREDFRVTGSSTVSLALQSLKVGTQRGPDGRANGGIWPVGNTLDPSPSPTDNVVVLDMTTGFPLQEFSKDGKPYLTVDKSRGSVTLLDSTPGDAAQTVQLIGLPTGPNPTDEKRTYDVSPFNRTFRVLYRARNEWAVQLLKGASQYTAVNSFTVGAGQYYIGGASGTSPTRVYFPASDARLKVTVDSISYVRADNSVGTIEGQDFVLQASPVSAGTSLSYLDIADLDPNAAAFVGGGQAVRGVKGASVTVRVLWNPEAFTLGDDQAENLRRVEQWGRSWRPSLTETFLRAEETR